MFQSVVRTTEFPFTRAGFATVSGAGVNVAAVALKIAARIFTIEGGSAYITSFLWSFAALHQ